MARKVVDKKLDSKAERSRLKPSPRPYYREIGQGLHLGFRKGRNGGTWVVRLYAGKPASGKGSPYIVERIGRADDDLTDADGETILTFHQAVEKARERQSDRKVANGAVVGPYRVRDAIADYLAEIAAKPSHQDAETRASAFILSDPIADLDLAALTADRIKRWHRSLAAQAPRLRVKNGASEIRVSEAFDPHDAEAVRRRRATANRMLTILKAALNHAFRESKVASDREWRRVKPFARVDAARVRYLTVAESKRFLNGCDSDLRPLAQAALETGARYSELARLRVEDFNPDVGTVTIRTSKPGKARHVVLTEEGQAFFWQVTAGRPGSELIFRKANGTEWRKSHQKRPVALANKRAKIDPPISFHILRHTWASLSVMAGVPKEVVAKNMGHSDSRMVEKHYGHLAPSYIADAIRAGAPRFGFKPGNVKPMTARQ